MPSTKTTLVVDVTVQSKSEVIKEVVEKCIRLSCYCCDKGIELDEHLWHSNGRSCSAYLIRKHFGFNRNLKAN